ncbi:hypothetical protein B0H11DRAFT_1713149, partial [Mycena galericulata]
ATSTSVERVFSQGRHVLVFTRNRLTGASIRKFLCFGSWSRKDLVRDADVIRAIEKTMGSKSKGKAKRKLVEADLQAEDKGEGSSKKARQA